MIDVGPEWQSCTVKQFVHIHHDYQYDKTAHNEVEYGQEHYGCTIDARTTAPLAKQYPLAVAYFGLQLVFFAVLTAIILVRLSLKDEREGADRRT